MRAALLQCHRRIAANASNLFVAQPLTGSASPRDAVLLAESTPADVFSAPSSSRHHYSASPASAAAAASDRPPPVPPLQLLPSAPAESGLTRSSRRSLASVSLRMLPGGTARPHPVTTARARLAAAARRCGQAAACRALHHQHERHQQLSMAEPEPGVEDTFNNTPPVDGFGRALAALWQGGSGRAQT